MRRERREPRRLEAKNCYVGQVVYWLMWYDPEEKPDKDNKYTAWYNYRPGRKPEIWSRKIAQLKPRTIVLEDFGKVKGFVYSCAQDAITAEYESFCYWHLGGIRALNWQPSASLGEASTFLRLLAELEFNLNAEVARTEKPIAEAINDS